MKEGNLPEPTNPEYSVEQSQAKLTELVALSRKVVDEGTSEYPWQGSEMYIRATYDDAWEKGRAGMLAFNRESTFDPNAFLEIKYWEHVRGADEDQTEKYYVFSKNDRGNVVLRASDTVSIDSVEHALLEDMLGGSSPEDEIKVLGATTILNHELDFSFKPATPDDMMKLQEILGIAATGDTHVSPEQMEYLSKILTETPQSEKTRLRKMADGAMRLIPHKKSKS